MADDISAYGKGYRAGRKRLQADDMRHIERNMREDFIQRMMISIAPQVIRSPWGKNKAAATPALALCAAALLAREAI